MRFIRLLILFIAVFLTSCQKPTPPPLHLGMVQWIGYSPLYIAEAHHALPSNLLLTDYLSNYDLIEAIKAGQIKAALLTLDEALRLQSHGIHLNVILVLDESYGGDALLVPLGINHVSELKGKRIAFEPQSVQEYLLYRALEKNQMTLADIQSVPIKYDQQLQNWQQHKIDGAATYDPQKTKLIQAGMKVLFDSSQIPGEIIDLLVVTDQALKTHHQTLQKTLHAWFKALPEVYSAKSQIIIADYLQTNSASIQTQLQGIRFGDRALNQKYLTGDTPELYRTAKHIQQYLNDNQKQTTTLSLPNIDPEFIQAKTP